MSDSRTHDAAQSILSFADEGLVRVLGENHEIDEFFSIAEPPDDCCNFMAIWAITEFVTDTFPDRPASFTRPALYSSCGILAAEMVLRCRIACWGQQQRPNYAEIERKSIQVSEMAEAVFDSLVTANGKNILLPRRGFQAALYDLTFEPPQGGCVGFDVKMVVQLGNACNR